MAGFGSKVRWSDGEAIVEGDFEQMADFGRRAMYDEFLSNFAGSPQSYRGRTYRDELRPYRNAMMPLILSASMDITMHGGLAVAVLKGAHDIDDTSLVPQSLAVHGNEDTVTISAAHGVSYRRDLIQARIVSEDESLVSRNFEDGVTRVKSSQNVLKRSNLVLEYGVKVGSLVASAALADLLANEPTPDAGWFRVASIQVPPTVTALDQRLIYDWRMPVGFGGTTRRAPECGTEDVACWEEKNFDFEQQVGQCQARIYMCNGNRQLGSDADGGFFRYDQRRIGTIMLRHRFQDNTSNYYNLGGQLQTGGDTFSATLDVESRISHGSFTSEAQLYRAEDVGFGSGVEDAPLWANGFRSPAANSFSALGNNSSIYELILDMRGGVGTGFNMSIKSCWLHWWGGL